MKLTIADDLVKVQKYAPERVTQKGTPRRRRDNPTSEAVKKNNQNLRIEKLQLLLYLNFRHGYIVALEYFRGSSPGTYQEADKIMMQTLKRIKRTHKNFKYIATTERGKADKNLHHHVIVESLEAAKLLLSSWGGYMPEPRQLYQDKNAFKSLAAYLIKQETKEERPKGYPSYHASKNLKKPSIEVVRVNEPWTEEPKPLEGYEIIPQSVVNGFNECLGIKYQSYMLKRKIEPQERAQDRTMKRRERTQKRNVFNPRPIKRTIASIKKFARAAGHGIKAAADYLQQGQQEP